MTFKRMLEIDRDVFSGDKKRTPLEVIESHGADWDDFILTRQRYLTKLAIRETEKDSRLCRQCKSTILREWK